MRKNVCLLSYGQAFFISSHGEDIEILQEINIIERY